MMGQSFKATKFQNDQAPTKGRIPCNFATLAPYSSPYSPALLVVVQQAEDVVPGEAIAALEEVELHGKAQAGNLAA